MKKELEDIKKTAEAHGTVSEQESEEKAADNEKIASETIKKEIEKEVKEEEAEKEVKTKAVEKETVKKKSEEKGEKRRKPWEKDREEITAEWEPKTKLGREVKDDKIKKIDEILEGDRKILEPEIVDSLLVVKSDLLSIGQSKGKFGGGKRRAWRQTQRKTKEGNVPTFSTLAVVGDGNGHVGIGTGKAKETLPARDKAIRKAKLNIMKVARSCSAFDCDCSELHTVPFKVTGKSGSVKVTLIPAPQGTGLVVANELKKVLQMAGIEDVYSQTFGQQKTSFNFVKACMNALEKTNLKIGGKER
jgi:small subunit ribosomal protein S5